MRVGHWYTGFMTKFRTLLLAVGILVVGCASGASAQYVNPTTEVRGITEERPPGTQPASAERTSEEVVVEETVEESESNLPVTGGDLVQLALIGAGAVAVGAALHYRRRRPAIAAFTPATPDASGRY